MLSFQAKKRKLGLLDDDDISKLGDIASAKEQNFVEGKDDDDLTSSGKIRGMGLSKMLGICIPDGKWFCCVLFPILSSTVFIGSIFLQITQRGLSTRSWSKSLKHQMSLWRF